MNWRLLITQYNGTVFVSMPTCTFAAVIASVKQLLNYVLLVWIRVWKVIRNYIGFVILLSVIGQQTYAIQSEEKARNRSRNGYPPFEAFSCLYFGFWLVTFGCCSLFRLAHVISLVLDFKIFSEPRTLLKDIMTKKLSEKTFTWISSTQVFTFWKEWKYSASFVSQELKSIANEHLQVPLLLGFYDKGTCLDFYLLP